MNTEMIKEKLSIIENEYSIPLSDDLRKDVSIMCNLSQGIVDKTKAEIIVNMYKKGFTPDQIADAVEVSLAEVEANIKKKEASVYNK